MMTIRKAFSNALKGTLADQWKDVIHPQPFGERDLVVPGVVTQTTQEAAPDSYVSESVISNGSIFYVPEGVAACILSGEGIEDVITLSGVYVYREGQGSVFAGDGLKAVVDEVINRFSFGGISPESKRISYVNLRELRDIKFGTNGPLPYYDSHYGVDLEVLSHGSFSIKVADPETVLKEFVPAGALVYSFDDGEAKSQLVSEIIQSLLISISSLSGRVRASELSSHLGELSESIASDERGAGSWPARFGLRLANISLHGISLSEDSKKLIASYSANRMEVHAYADVSKRAADIAAQQRIAKGIASGGLGEAGNTIIGMNIAQGFNAGSERPSFEEQTTDLMRLKQLLDDGILTQEEFDMKKREILGL